MGGVILREPGDKKIMMADDCALYRAELRGVINKQGRLRVGAEAECGGQTIKIVSKVPADAILFALRLPRHTGYKVLRRIREISDIRKKS
jgi:DNA-binding NarL/FixJ family response regulator